jgi:D-3-phosphoglycerate dehydrogenase
MSTAGLPGLREYLGEPDDIVRFVDGAEILINHLAPVNGDILDRLPALKLIAVSRGGPVNIDVAACKARKVKLVNTPGRNSSAVAEFTIAAILAETRLIRAGHESLRQGVWRGDLYRFDKIDAELSEMTVGLIGYGHIGTKVVRLLKPFGCRILVCDPYVPLSAEDREDDVEQVDLDTLLKRSDCGQPACPCDRRDQGFPRRAAVRAHEAGRLFHQYRARADGELRRSLPGAEVAPYPRGDAGDFLAGAAAGGLARCSSLTMSR